jgi:hypothetical protein
MELSLEAERPSPITGPLWQLALLAKPGKFANHRVAAVARNAQPLPNFPALTATQFSYRLAQMTTYLAAHWCFPLGSARYICPVVYSTAPA